MSRYSDAAVTELLNAGYAVATYASPNAYRKGRPTHGIGRHDLRRLLDALAALDLTDEARAEVDSRRRAWSAAEADYQAYRRNPEHWPWTQLVADLRDNHGHVLDPADKEPTFTALRELHAQLVEAGSPCPLMVP